MAKEEELEEKVNISPEIKTFMNNMYSGLKEQINDLYGKYEDFSAKIKDYTTNIKQQKAKGVEIGVDSPLVKHYIAALQYKKFLGKTLKFVYNAFEDIKKWETRYAKPLGAIGRFRAMRGLRKQKREFRDLLRYARTAVPAVLLIASFLLLGFSAGHMTGFVIAGNKIPAGYPIGAGFILLLVAFCLSFLRRKKKENQKKQAGKKKAGRKFKRK